MKKWLFIWICLGSAPAMASVPQQITYQGTLKQAGIAANGSFTMTFQLTDSSGKTQYWNSGPMSVNVTQGLFSVPLSPTGVDWANVSPYIVVSVGGQTLSPPEPVTSTAYALECGSIKGMIAMFADSCPAGWTRFAALDNRFPMGGMSYGTVGGSATHNHGGWTGKPSAILASDAGANFGSPAPDHLHSISPDSNIPPYLTVVFCQKQ
jgi:hypothetical protein